MSLPKISHPTFKATLPSSGQEISYRPMTNKEQKILMIAKESEDNKDAIKAAAQVVGNCFNLDPMNIALVDLEFLFLLLRAKSVGSKIEVKYKDGDKDYEATVDLDKINIEYPEGHDKSTFEVVPGVFITMKDAPVGNVLKATSEIDHWEMLTSSIKSITSGDDVTNANEVTREELKEWMMGLPTKSMVDLKTYFDTRPKVKVPLTYMKEGKEISIEVSGFSHFFD